MTLNINIDMKGIETYIGEKYTMYRSSDKDKLNKLFDSLVSMGLLEESYVEYDEFNDVYTLTVKFDKEGLL